MTVDQTTWFHFRVIKSVTATWALATENKSCVTIATEFLITHEWNWVAKIFQVLYTAANLINSALRLRKKKKEKKKKTSYFSYRDCIMDSSE